MLAAWPVPCLYSLALQALNALAGLTIFATGTVAYLGDTRPQGFGYA